MNWIDLGMEKIVQCINEEHIDYTFPKIEDDSLSYFEAYNMGTESVLEEFAFSTIPELIELLKRKRLINFSALDIACAIAAFKNKPSVEKTDMTYEGEYMIPTFIYNF